MKVWRMHDVQFGGAAEIDAVEVLVDGVADGQCVSMFVDYTSGIDTRTQAHRETCRSCSPASASKSARRAALIDPVKAVSTMQVQRKCQFSTYTDHRERLAQSL